MRKASIILILLVSMSAFAGDVFTFSQEPELFRKISASDMIIYPPVRMWTLDNGLVVLFWENHLTPTVSMRVGVKTGSQYEGKFLGAGISHYLEHVVSGGTTSRMAEQDYIDYLGSIGATSNAYTSRNLTCYYITGPSREFEGQLQALSDWVTDCAFDKTEVDRERGVITQEIYKGLEEPNRVMWDLINSTVFQLHPARYPIIGYIENFLRITRDDLIEYYNSFYSPDNSVLTIAGAVTYEEARAYVDSFFGDWDRRIHILPTIPDEPPQLTARYAEATAEVQTSTMSIIWRGAQRGDDDGYALSVMSSILAGSRTSRLDRRLILDEKLVRSVNAYHSSPPDQPSMFMIRVNDFDYQNRDRILDIIHEEIQRIIDRGVDKRELEREKNLIVKSLMYENETVEGQTSSMQFNYLYYGRPTALDFLVPKYMEVEREDIQRAMKKYLVPQTMNVTVIKPPTEETDHEIAIKAEGKMGFVRHVLPNGITVVAAENYSVPHFNVNIFFNAGLRYEPKGKIGVSNLMADYLMEGVRGYTTPDKLSEYIDWHGYNVSTSGGNNTVSLDGTFLSMDIEAGIDLLARLAFEPTFPRESLDRLKERALMKLQADANQWSSDAFYYYRNVYFGDHPYSNNPTGTPETIVALTRDDVVNFHRMFMQPNNAVIGIAGPMPVDEIIALAEKYFGKKRGSDINFPTAPPPPVRTEEEQHIKTTNRGQITLMIGFPAPNIYSEERFALPVMQGFLSGMRGRLHRELRGTRDLVYLVWGSNFLGPEAGTFYVMTQTSPENYDTVKAVILHEIERVKMGDFDEQDLARSRATIREGFYRGRQEQENHVFSAALNELYGLGFDYEYQYLENIDQVTKEDIVDFANKYLNNPVTVLLAPDGFGDEG